MADIEHSQLTDPFIHEPKGVLSAAASRVYLSDGVGSGDWSLVTQAALAPTAKAFETLYMRCSDVQVAGTAGGTFNQGVWTQRALNTVFHNGISGASLAASQITLPAGTYHVKGSAPAYAVVTHQTSFYNVTDSLDYIFGLSERSTSAVDASSRSFFEGRFSIAAPKVFSIRHLCTSTYADFGLGAPANCAVEIYADVHIWKVSE